MEKYREDKIIGLLNAETKGKSIEEKIRKLEEWTTILNNAKPPNSISYFTPRDFDLYLALFGYPPGNKQWNNDEDIKKWHEKKEKYIDSIKDYKKSLEEKNYSKKHKIQVKKEKENEKQIDQSKNYELRLKNISESLNNALREDPNNEELKKLQENINTAKDIHNIDKNFYKNLVDAIQNQVHNQNSNKRIGKHIIINNNNLNYDYNVVADAYEKLVELHETSSAFLISKLDDKNKDINKDDVRKYYNHIKDLNKKIADWANAIYNKNDAVIYDKNTGEITINIPPAQLLYVIDEINKETNDSFIELKTKDINKEPWKTSFNSTMAEFKEDAKNQLQTQKNETNNIININIESLEQLINNAQFNDKKALEDELKKIKEEKEKLKPESSLDDLNKISAKLTILHNKIYFANQDFENKRTKVMAILKSFPQEQENAEGQFEIENKKYKKEQLIQLLNDNQLSETSCDEIINKYENEIKPINENKNLKEQMSNFMEKENKAINLISNNKDLFSQDIIKQAEEVEKSNKEWQPRLNAVPHATQSFFDDWKNSPALSDEQGFEKKGANAHDFTLETIEQKVKNLETLTDSINLIRNFSSKDNAEKIKSVSSGIVDNISTLPKIEDFLNRQISITNAEGEQITKTVFEIFKKDLKTKLENCQQTLLLFSDKFQSEIDSINDLINLINDDQNNIKNFPQIKEKIKKLSPELQNFIKNPPNYDNIKEMHDIIRPLNEQNLLNDETKKIGTPSSITKTEFENWYSKALEILIPKLKEHAYHIIKNKNFEQETEDASISSMDETDINKIKQIKQILKNPNPSIDDARQLTTFLCDNNNNLNAEIEVPEIEVPKKDKKELIKRIDEKIDGLNALLKRIINENKGHETDPEVMDKIRKIITATKKLKNMRSDINASNVYNKNVHYRNKIKIKEIQEPFTKKIGPWGNKIFYMKKQEQEQEH